MRSRTFTKIRRAMTAFVTSIVIAGVATLSATPASANINDGYIAGTGAVTDDFSDEATLWEGSPYWHSNAVAVVQRILYAELLLDSVEIDCAYGGDTTYAVRQLQRRLGFTGSDVDGVVGPATWARLDSRLQLGGAYSETTRYVNYNATTGLQTRFLRVTSSGSYFTQARNSGWGQTLYRTAQSTYCG